MNVSRQRRLGGRVDCIDKTDRNVDVNTVLYVK